MRRSIPALIVAAAVLSLASTAGAATTHRCTQTSITANESQRVITIELVRSGNIIKPSVGMIQVFGTRNWFLEDGLFRLEFAAGEVRKSIRLNIDDQVYTGTQTTNAVCGGTIDGVTLPAQSELTITVTDNEQPPTVIVPAVFNVTETDAVKEIGIPISLSTPFGRGGIVRVQATSTSAELHHDYLTTIFVLFDPDETTDVIRFTVLGDEIPEIDKEILITLSGDVPTTQFVVRIVDDDQAPFTVAFDKSSYDFVEGMLTVTLTRAGDTTIPFTAILRVASALPYLWPEPVPVPFAAGETTKTVSIPFDDSAYSADRSGFLDAVVNLSIVARTAITVRDNDPLPVLSIVAVSAREHDPPSRGTFVFSVRLSTAVGLPLPLRVQTFNGTADATDYIPLDTTVTILAGATGAFVRVTVIGDDLVEPDETFGVKIIGCCSGLAAIGNDTATTTIFNDDAGRPRTLYKYDDVPSNVKESEKWLTATVIKEHNLDVATNATVRLSRLHAPPFTPINLRFEPGETRKPIRFYIDDPFYTPSASAELTIYAGSVFQEDRRAIAITDDEPRSVVSIEGFDVLESELERHIRVTVEPPSTVTIVLRARVKDAPEGAAAVPEVVHVPAFSSTILFPVSIVVDDVPEPDVTFVVAIELTEPSAHATIGQGEAICTVRDDDAAGARLKFTTDFVARGEKMVVTLELDAPAPIDDVVHVSTSSPAILGIPATFQIAAGSRTATFEVEGMRAGVGFLKVDLPASLGSGELDAAVSVHSLAMPVVPELTQTVVAGETVEIDVAMSPPLDHDVRLETMSFDNRLLLTGHELIVPAGGTGKLRVRGVKPGRGTIEIRVPEELGGSVVHVPFDVTLPM